MMEEMKMADRSANQSAKDENNFQNDYSTKISPVKEHMIILFLCRSACITRVSERWQRWRI